MLRSQAAHGPLRSYGRVQSRPVKAAQKALFDSLLPRISLPDPAVGPIDPAALVPGMAETWLEIGFGGGEHLAAQARRAPQVLLLGAEPFVNGVGSCLRHLEEARVENVRLLHGDGRALLAALPDASLARVFILFPDPWPKARHHKRRLIQTEVIDELARVMKPGARLRFATDWADYVDWTLAKLQASKDFRWLAERADDWRIPPADHITTRYEEKRLGDCAPIFLEFVRV
jgi:tRNA (guanine-N7-)-methyltransferase